MEARIHVTPHTVQHDLQLLKLPGAQTSDVEGVKGMENFGVWTARFHVIRIHRGGLGGSGGLGSIGGLVGSPLVGSSRFGYDQVDDRRRRRRRRAVKRRGWLRV